MLRQLPLPLLLLLLLVLLQPQRSAGQSLYPTAFTPTVYSEDASGNVRTHNTGRSCPVERPTTTKRETRSVFLWETTLL